MKPHLDLSAYIDDALSAEEKRAAESHLSNCASCQKELAELKSTLQWMKKAGQVKTPAGLDDRILARLEQTKRSSVRPWAWGLSGGFATAAISALIFLSLPKEAPQRSDAGAPAQIEEKALAKDAVPMAPPAAKAKLSLKDQIVARSAVPTARVIRGQEDWIYPDLKPAPDFSKEMVLVLFDGKIVSQKIENGTLVVRYRRAPNPTPKRPTDWRAVPLFDGPVQFQVVE